MTYRISPTPWRVDMDYILDTNGDRILRALPQGKTTADTMAADFIQDDELARYQLQLAATAPELLAALHAVTRCLSWHIAQHGPVGMDMQAFNQAEATAYKATTVDFQDGNPSYRQLAHDKANEQ